MEMVGGVGGVLNFGLLSVVAFFHQPTTEKVSCKYFIGLRRLLKYHWQHGEYNHNL